MKIRFLFLELLMCMSLLSIGFASWQIESIGNIYGDILTDELVNYSNFIDFDSSISNAESGVKTLRYFNEGFLNDNNEIVSSGYIQIFFEIKLDNCKLEYEPQYYSGLSVVIELSQTITDIDMFQNISDERKVEIVAYDENNEVLTSNLKYSPFNYSTEILFDYAEYVKDSYIKFSIRYNFIIVSENENYFNINIYPYLKNEEFKFSSYVKIEGVER